MLNWKSGGLKIQAGIQGPPVHRTPLNCTISGFRVYRGLILDRDHNAVVNMFKRGLALSGENRPMHGEVESRGLHRHFR